MLVALEGLGRNWSRTRRDNRTRLLPLWVEVDQSIAPLVGKLLLL